MQRPHKFGVFKIRTLGRLDSARASFVYSRAQIVTIYGEATLDLYEDDAEEAHRVFANNPDATFGATDFYTVPNNEIWRRNVS